MPTEKSLYIPFLWNDPRRYDKQYADAIDPKDSVEPVESDAERLERGLFWHETKFVVYNVLRRPGRTSMAAFTLWLKKGQSKLTQMLVRKFRSNEYKYAFRVAFLVTFGSIFGFLEESREAYHEWKGQWALFTIAVVSSSTVGGSTSLGFWRTLGTAFGGLMAFLLWTLFPGVESIWSHAIFTLLFALPCTYLRLCTKYVRLGLVILVAYTIVFFGEYVQEREKALGLITETHDTIFQLFYKRTVSIILGVAVSLIGTIAIFPTFARSALRNKVALIIRNLSHLYSKVSIAIVCGTDVQYETGLADFLSLEFKVQLEILEAQELLAPTTTEFSFDGQPFPSEAYKRILVQCQGMLDGLLANRLAVFIGFSGDFRASILSIAHEERKLVLGAALLYFSVLHG